MAKIKATEGLGMVCNMITTSALSVESGVNRTIISYGMHNSISNGKPYYLTQKNIDALNIAFGKIGSMLKCTTITVDDAAEQIKLLCKTVSIKYIFCECMGENVHWYQNRMAGRKTKFKEEDVRTINRIISEIADALQNTELVIDDPDVFNPESLIDIKPKVTIPLPPYQDDYEDIMDYARAWQKWETTYFPTKEDIRTLREQQMRERLNLIPNPNQEYEPVESSAQQQFSEIPLPPYQYDFDTYADYSKAYDEWKVEYRPTPEQL